MSGKSKKTIVVTMRLPIEVIAKINVALTSTRNGDASVGDYCKNVITRYAFRHERKK